ncbi:MAG: glycosyltransferase family 9 protein [Planctomycetota bacterium]|nr:glycosyltransferase family 9 protein [Planctomycetota bacterium]
MCRSVPVAVSVRAKWPGAEIDWLVQDSFAAAVEAHPAVSRVVRFPRSEVRVGDWWMGRARRRLWSFLGSLRERRYDLVLDCQGLGRSGVFAWWTGAGRRVGFSSARELGWLGYTERHDAAASMHTVDRMLRLIELAGIEPVRDMRLYTTEESRGRAAELAGEGGFIVVAPTSRWAGKRWPAERFVEVMEGLRREAPGVRAVIVGAEHEREQIGVLLERSAAWGGWAIDAVGRTPVGVLMALIERSRLVIANDSAALHMAVGFDRALIGLFGPTNVSLVGPYGRERDVIQEMHPGERNRHKNEAWGRAAMEAISSRRVLEAALERLAEPGGSFKR